MPAARQGDEMRLSTDKRNKLIGVGVLTAVVMGLLWFYLIGAQEAKLREIAEQTRERTKERQQIRAAIGSATKIEADYQAASQKLEGVEEEIATGDLYSWFYNTIKNFKAAYHVDIPEFSNVELSDTTMLYKFPYKQVKISVSGTAYFNDFGHFVADFENHFPHMRIENVSLQPVNGGEREADREKLSFKMDIIALVNEPPVADKK
jgi:Tfp pilus assembly protein PilO